ncbi:MAG: hypothetical protein AB1689_24260 [Thermodesulfobacteriota bacterium]
MHARRSSRRRTAIIVAAWLLGVIRVAAAWASPGLAGEPREIPGGRLVEVRGEVVETSCYLRDGARGEGHRACALVCLKNGGQLAIVEDDTGTLYPLAGSTPASDPSAAAREHIAAHVVARGQVFERAGGRVLVVHELGRLGP